MTTPCPRCHTYCFGDCTASAPATFRTTSAPARKSAEGPEMIGTLVTFRGKLERKSRLRARLVEEQQRLGRLKDRYAIESTEELIADLTATLKG